MKQIILGDIHGHDSWKKILEKEDDYDKVIFLGDYHDSFSIPSKDIISNFKSIVKLKNSQKDKVILLIGNHDYHYMRSSVSQFSGFRGELKLAQQDLLEELVRNDILQVCYKDGQNRLYSHAGVSKSWCEDNFMDGIDLEYIDQDINNLFKENLYAFDFKYKISSSPYGDNIYQGPLWIRPNSLYQDAIDGVDQVIGHTQPREITIIKSRNNQTIYLNDILGNGYYMIAYRESIQIKKI